MLPEIRDIPNKNTSTSKLKFKEMPCSDLHQSVPDELRQRLLNLKVLSADTFTDDSVFELNHTKMKVVPPDLNALLEKQLPTLDHILEERDIDVDTVLELMSRAYSEVKLKHEAAADGQSSRHASKKVNWIAEYVKKLRRHRVIWNSKIYKGEDSSKTWYKRPMISNVDAMIDLSAVEFADWCNSLASDEKAKTVTPELIKKLFSIETEGTAPRGLSVEPADLRILPPVVIRHFDPSSAKGLDLETKMDKLRAKDAAENARPARGHAFGRSLPKELKQRKRIGVATDFNPQFPDDLISQKTLFKGIEHLQITRSIFQHIGETKEFPLPQYLRKNSIFNEK